MDERGFTIVELLIVLVVIGILAGLVLNAFTGVNEEAQISKAQHDLRQLDSSVTALSVHVGKWPNGCPIGFLSDPEVDVVDAEAGLSQVPPIGMIDVGCEWTAADVVAWDGPYLTADDMIDPWGNSYVFDPDYRPWLNCATETTLPEISVVATYGPDLTHYTCDDVYAEISGQ